jgi:hypothetical protein
MYFRPRSYGPSNGKWARPDGLLKTRGNETLTRAVWTGVLAVRTILGQHRFLQSFGTARSKASGQAANGMRTGFERSTRVLVLELHHVWTVHVSVRTVLVPMQPAIPRSDCTILREMREPK